MDAKYEFEMHSDPESQDSLDAVLPGMLALFVADDQEAVYVGSGFMTDPNGGFVTARHVGAELVKLEKQTYGAARASALLMGPTVHGLVWISTLNMSPDDNVTSDLATGQLALTADAMPYFELSRDPVVVGEEVVAIGHTFIPGQTFAAGGLFTVTGGLTMLYEPVVETYEKWTNLPAPVFRLDCEMPGGMSGGPILRATTGQVVGVCAYALGPGGEEHEPYCYGSMLGPLWEPYGAGSGGWLPG